MFLFFKLWQYFPESRSPHVLAKILSYLLVAWMISPLVRPESWSWSKFVYICNYFRSVSKNHVFLSAAVELLKLSLRKQSLDVQSLKDPEHSRAIFQCCKLQYFLRKCKQPWLMSNFLGDAARKMTKLLHLLHLRK